MIGYCKFCGQCIDIDAVADVERLEDDCAILPGVVADVAVEIATLNCTCNEGIPYRAQQKKKNKVMKNISALFGDDAPEGKKIPDDIIDILERVGSLLCAARIEKAAINLRGVKASLSVNSKGEIKVERTETSKQQLTE